MNDGSLDEEEEKGQDSKKKPTVVIDNIVFDRAQLESNFEYFEQLAQAQFVDAQEYRQNETYTVTLPANLLLPDPPYPYWRVLQKLLHGGTLDAGQIHRLPCMYHFLEYLGIKWQLECRWQNVAHRHWTDIVHNITDVTPTQFWEWYRLRVMYQWGLSLRYDTVIVPQQAEALLQELYRLRSVDRQFWNNPVFQNALNFWNDRMLTHRYMWNLLSPTVQTHFNCLTPWHGVKEWIIEQQRDLEMKLEHQVWHSSLEDMQQHMRLRWGPEAYTFLHKHLRREFVLCQFWDAFFVPSPRARDLGKHTYHHAIHAASQLPLETVQSWLPEGSVSVILLSGTRMVCAIPKWNRNLIVHLCMHLPKFFYDGISVYADLKALYKISQRLIVNTGIAACVLESQGWTVQTAKKGTDTIRARAEETYLLIDPDAKMSVQRMRHLMTALFLHHDALMQLGVSISD